jgi:hypothetical protein
VRGSLARFMQRECCGCAPGVEKRTAAHARRRLKRKNGGFWRAQFSRRFVLRSCLDHCPGCPTWDSGTSGPPTIPHVIDLSREKFLRDFRLSPGGAIAPASATHTLGQPVRYTLRDHRRYVERVGPVTRHGSLGGVTRHAWATLLTVRGT